MKKKTLLLLVVFFTILAVTSHALATPSRLDCQHLANAFLTAPTKNSLSAIQLGDGTGCWSMVGSTNGNINKLLQAAQKGNRWAAQYLAENLKNLDGGNLEDSLIALGQFSEHRMENFLAIAKEGRISKSEFTDALTMLPLSLSDDQTAQLVVLEARIHKVKQITRKDLIEQKTLALSAINEFIVEIKATNRTR